MDWSSPYYVAAVSLWAVVECAYIVMMTVTGYRHREALARADDPIRGGGAVAASTLAPEELGLLAGGRQRVAEVALLRLHLEGRVVLDRGYLAMAENRATDGKTVSDDDANPVREALLDRLSRRKRTILADVVQRGERAVYRGEEHWRLVQLGLWSGAGARNARTRQRAFNVYLYAITFSLVAVTLSLTPASRDWNSAKYIAAGVIALFLAVTMLLNWVMAMSNGGAMLRPSTAAGMALLTEARQQSLATSGETLMRHAAQVGRVPRDKVYQAQDAVLRYVALYGLARLAKFKEAIELSEPVTERGLGKGMKAFQLAAEILHSLGEFLSGGR